MKLHYSFSNEKECETIHAYSLTILEDTGIVVHSPNARAILKHKGAQVDGKKVFLPSKLVEKYLSFVPSSFSLYSPNHRLS
ncbi:MAG: trimethylamine methyltransferase family protein, partial [Eubacterium sp.]